MRLARADLRPEPAIFAADDTLDWTAFQMAILGGAGDFFSGSVDFSRRAEEDEVDALAALIEDLGLEIGGLHGEREEREEQHQQQQRRTKAQKRDSSHSDASCGSNGSNGSGSSALGPAAAAAALLTPALTLTASPASPASASLPIPVAAEHPSGFWNDGASQPDADRFLAAHHVGLKRWTVEGHPKRYAGGNNRESVESLPQSPMLDLVVSRGADGGEYIVPMGYNLGHDLGDFLRWEAENVYAPEFGKSQKRA